MKLMLAQEYAAKGIRVNAVSPVTCLLMSESFPNHIALQGDGDRLNCIVDCLRRESGFSADDGKLRNNFSSVAGVLDIRRQLP